MSELEYRELLMPIVRDGSAVAPREGIKDARERCAWALDHLDAAFKRFLYPQTYVVGMGGAWLRCATSSCAEHGRGFGLPWANDPKGRGKRIIFVRPAPGTARPNARHSIGLTYDDFL
ncbi:MAG: hypothetical protein ACLU0O_01860 [Collinsella sp.]